MALSVIYLSISAFSLFHPVVRCTVMLRWIVFVYTYIRGMTPQFMCNMYRRSYPAVSSVSGSGFGPT